MSNKKFLFIGESPMLLMCVLYISKFYKDITVITKDKNIAAQIPKKIKIKKNWNIINLTEFDYLFSVMNGKIIRKKLPHNLICLNFHDALLPNYAGLFCSSWVILNKEKRHGATWHKISTKIDRGDILFKKSFKIKKNLTAYELDNQSIFFGYFLFKKIIDKIKNGIKLIFRRQNKSKFNYYSYDKRKNIPNYGFVDLDDNYKKILLLYNALSLSRQKKNKFCKLKLRTNKGIKIIKKITIIKNNINAQNKSQIIYLKNSKFVIKFNKVFLEFKLKDSKDKHFKILKLNKKYTKKHLNYGISFDKK